MKFRSGFISIVGRPNAGKSTLLNALLGEKISIVSFKPQTTRNVIRGVKHMPGVQMIFIDTPGIHTKKKGPLNEFMVREALSSLRDVDAALFLVDAEKGVTDEDRFIIEGFGRLKSPVVLGVNKTDAVKKPALLPLIASLSALFSFAGVVPISALRGDGLEELSAVLAALLPEGPRYFPDDAVTDLPERFVVAEMIREKVFNLTREEVPYSVAVVVESFEEKKGGRVVAISAAINVERESQKGIVIGRRGAMLKRIGTSARAEIERFLGARVFLELFVRVAGEWTRSARAMKGFGY